jgi:hypothetical protein
LDKRTTLVRVQPHRLKALILEDLERFPDSSAGEIHRRVAPEVAVRAFSRTLRRFVKEGLIEATGMGRWRRYRATRDIGQESVVADRSLLGMTLSHCLAASCLSAKIWRVSDRLVRVADRAFANVTTNPACFRRDKT